MKFNSPERVTLLQLMSSITMMDLLNIRHGSNHGRFSRPRKAIKEVTLFPSFPNSCVEILCLTKRNQVINHLLLLLSLHGKGLKIAG
ncbi:unnamed protein product, partial [Vitis vinifera]